MTMSFVHEVRDENKVVPYALEYYRAITALCTSVQDPDVLRVMLKDISDMNLRVFNPLMKMDTK